MKRRKWYCADDDDVDGTNDDNDDSNVKMSAPSPCTIFLQITMGMERDGMVVQGRAGQSIGQGREKCDNCTVDDGGGSGG